MSDSSATERAVIGIRGARTHNLQNIDLDLPAGRMIAVTGISGSGKSSLAFDTLFAEGQRRYLESVSTRTRHLIRQLRRPDVDDVFGLPPTVSVDQRVRSVPARSTLAVTTEIHDFLRLLFSRAGQVHCTQCGNPVESQTPDQIVSRAMQFPERTRCLVLAPLVRNRRGAHRDVMERIARFGFVRVRIDGQLHDIADAPELKPAGMHDIEAVVDRVIIKTGAEQRLRESVELASREAEGTCILCCEIDGEWKDHFFSTRFCCPACDLSFSSPEPGLLNFMSAAGACPACEGFGFEGVTDEVDDVTIFRRTPCSDCQGSRLQPIARSISFLKLTIAELTALTVDEALDQVKEWQASPAVSELTQSRRIVAERVFPDLRERLECLIGVGLGYLRLDRFTRSLSGGEYQRARLATCLGSSLSGACYVLDEPTSGLHDRDTEQLLQTIQAIRDRGSTLIVVEHDLKLIRNADWVVEVGPGAGSHGGRVIFSGATADLEDCSDSVTAPFLRHGPAPTKRSAPANVADTDNAKDTQQSIHIRGARLHTLAKINISIPVGRHVGITGVSGSGKSTLIMETLLPAVEAHLQSPDLLNTRLKDVECDELEVPESIQRVVSVGLSPTSRNRRSSIVTITGVWNDIRKLFAGTRAARALGYKSSRFSFNSGDGRCSECRGTGQQDVRMALLPEAVIPCPACHGQRFDAATLRVKFLDHNVDDVLQLSVEAAADLFSEVERVRKVLDTLNELGLGYLTLGQPASTWSGGELQRVRLATGLTVSDYQPTLFLLDEPTRGLHPADVEYLLSAVNRLVQIGHSVIVIEHNLRVIQQADWIIDMGPGAGPDGGQVVFEGTPDQLVTAETFTGEAMRQYDGHAR